MSVSTKEMERRHHLASHLLMNNETVIAAIAWQGFQKQGRGYVMVALPLQAVANMERATVMYVRKSERIKDCQHESELDDAPKRELEKILETYNPRKEFVAMFVWVDPFMSSELNATPTEHWFRHLPHLTPVQAFTTVKYRPSEFGIETTPASP
jgi:hypothetical protein